MAKGTVRIELTSDVALVLFEWLERHADQDWERLPDAHSGELSALTVLAGALESRLAQPFDGRYNELVEAARQRLAEQYGIKSRGASQD
ncbi:hypothetical protein ACWKWC_10695 [Geodermatophilus nigrescens]